MKPNRLIAPRQSTRESSEIPEPFPASKASFRYNGTSTGEHLHLIEGAN